MVEYFNCPVKIIDRTRRGKKYRTSDQHLTNNQSDLAEIYRNLQKGITQHEISHAQMEHFPEHTMC